jgi:hypothetical protein
MSETPDKAEHRTLRQGTVGERLDSMQWNLLPQDIRNDPNAYWVLSHDNFDDRTEYDELSDPGPDEAAYHAAWKAITGLLQERLPFYVATLFHIGRQWKISESVANEARRLRDEKNLIGSAENLVGLARQTGRFLDPVQAQATVSALSDVAAERHDRALAQARIWWSIWLKEVSELRELVISFTEQAPRRREQPRTASEQRWLTTFTMFLFYQQRPSRIKSALRDGGVQLQDEVEVWPQTATGLIGAPILFGIAALATQYDPHALRIFFENWQHAVRDFAWQARRIEIEPQIRSAEIRLRQRYGDRNPFADFAVGKNAASEHLVALLRENVFVDGERSEWRKDWEKTLESYPHFDSFNARPPAEQALDQARIARATASADSTIKARIDSGKRSPIETFPEFCQRIFEEHWVKKIGYFIFQTSSASAAQRKPWALVDFKALLTAVVRSLNATGYKLTVPEEARLSTLITKAQQGEQEWTLDW